MVNWTRQRVRYHDDAFQKAVAVRMEVFVGEQKVPAHLEMDALDAQSLHWILVDERLEKVDAAATLRLFLTAMDINSNQLVLRMGRVAVRLAQRGLGLGSKLMKAVECEIVENEEMCLDELMQAFLKREHRQLEWTQWKEVLENGALNIRIELHAQADKIGFYEKNGYQAKRDPSGNLVTFVEDGILHCNMDKSLSMSK